jgi:hypothetical protein
MEHKCTFELDLDGSLTCSECGAMNKDIFETQVDFE